jgi:acetylglutamate kinase
MVKEVKNKKNDIEFHPDNKNKIEKIYIDKAQILCEALPYIKEYFNKIVVIKIGGSMMEDDKILQGVLDDIILMKYVGIKVVLIHGGGKQITELMEERNIKVEFVDGLRVSNEETMDVVRMVLIGSINTKIVSFLNKHGDIAVGISGNDANFIKCTKKYYKKNNKNVDLGYVGEIVEIDSNFIKNILSGDYIPVIATLGTDAKGNIYNINADSCASEIAVSLNAMKMVLLTDVDGIKKRSDDSGQKVGKAQEKLISRSSSEKCVELIKDGEISSGMIPKVMACVNSLKGGVERTYILNGTRVHSILIEIFTDKGIGTMITK